MADHSHSCAYTFRAAPRCSMARPAVFLEIRQTDRGRDTTYTGHGSKGPFKEYVCLPHGEARRGHHIVGPLKATRPKKRRKR